MVPYFDDQPILLIDQDEVVRDSLKALLESHVLLVRDFRSAEEFLAAAELPSGKCLILGFNRYVADGIFDLPAIFAGGGGSDMAQTATSTAGAFAYLERPVAEAALIQAVRNATSERGGADTKRPASRGALIAHP